MEANGGALGNSFEHHMTVSDLTVSLAKRERMNAVHAMTVTKDVAVFCNLQQERSSYVGLSVFCVRMLHRGLTGCGA